MNDKYRGRDNPNNSHGDPIKGVEMKLVPLVRPYLKGRRSRRLRKNRWVAK